MSDANSLTYRDVLDLFGTLNSNVASVDELWSQFSRKLEATRFLESINVARLEISIIIESSIYDYDGSDDFYSYDSGLPANESAVAHKSYPTNDNGHGEVDAYPVAGYEFTDDDIAQLYSFGNLIYVFMSRIRLAANIEKIKYMDLLTGIYNTAGMRREGKRLEAVGELFSMAVIFLNLRSFTAVNKRVGMKNGDLILNKYAKLLHTLSTMNGGIEARLGGDKFLLIIPKSQLDTALSILSHVQLDVQILDHSESVDVHAWMGVHNTTETDGIDDALSAASAACEKARGTGSDEPVYI